VCTYLLLISYILILHIAPTVIFNQSTYNVIEDDGPVQPVLVLSNPSSTDITISVFSNDESATGKDTLLPSTLKIPVYNLQEVMTTVLEHTM